MHIMPSLSRLTDLPRELLEQVYDLLEVSDRVRLNLSLPKGSAVTKTTRTSTANDAKIAVVYMFLKRRASLLGASEVRVNEMSPAMCKFFQKNITDPTLIRIATEMPQVVPAPLAVHGRLLLDLITMIRERQPIDAGAIAWTEFVYDIEDVVQAVVTSGTPNMFDKFMATHNCFQTYILQHFNSFVFGLVNYGNSSLLTHLMHLQNQTEFSALVDSSRSYLASSTVLHVFISCEDKVQAIVECIGVEMPVLQRLLEEASRRMLMPTVMYLLHAGIRM